MRVFWWIALAIATPALALPPYATQPAPVQAPVEDPFAWEIAPVVVPQGGEARLELRLVVPEGHVAYRDQMEVRVVEAGPLKPGAVDFPPPMVKHDPITGVDRELYVDDVVVWLPLKAPKTYTGGVTLVVETTHQGCRPGLCFPQTTIEHTVLVPVRPTSG